MMKEIDYFEESRLLKSLNTTAENMGWEIDEGLRGHQIVFDVDDVTEDGKLGKKRAELSSRWLHYLSNQIELKQWKQLTRLEEKIDEYVKSYNGKKIKWDARELEAVVTRGRLVSTNVEIQVTVEEGCTQQDVLASCLGAIPTTKEVEKIISEFC